METTPVIHEVEWLARWRGGQEVERGEGALSGRCRRLGAGFGAFDGAPGHVDAEHLEAEGGEPDRVRSGPATDVERASGSEPETLHRVDKIRVRFVGVPRKEPLLIVLVPASVCHPRSLKASLCVVPMRSAGHGRYGRLMSELTNRCYRLRSRPERLVTEDVLELVEEPVPSIGPGQALARTRYLSLDPSNRIWMSDARSYLPPVPIGDVMRGIGICEVIESQRDDMRPGDFVTGFSGWQEYVVVDDADEFPLTVLPAPLPAPAPALLGPLGHTGITAYLGIEDIADLKPGETMVVSAAAGAVGSIAAQIGKARGARVVGLAGSDDKCKHLVDEFGLDACVNYKADDWREQLDGATPDGIDVDFENAGGEIMDHVLRRINIGARIVLCGMISQYTSYGDGAGPAGQREIAQLIMRRATMRGFLVLDHADRFPEAIEYLAGLLANGQLQYDETIVEGLENAPQALNDMFSGANVGKLLIKVS